LQDSVVEAGSLSCFNDRCHCVGKTLCEVKTLHAQLLFIQSNDRYKLVPVTLRDCVEAIFAAISHREAQFLGLNVIGSVLAIS
jgi:hypothetical protein